MTVFNRYIGIWEAKFSTRVRGIVARFEDTKTSGDLARLCRSDIMSERHAGIQTAKEIESFLRECGLEIPELSGACDVPYIELAQSSKPKDPPRCGNCAHWVPLETKNVNRGGACRRYPPKAGVPIETGSSILGGRPTEEFERWPTTREGERCGEWTAQ